MFIKIFLCAIAVGVVFSDSVEDELKTIYKSDGQPFFELPCIVAGGTCAKEGSCPEDTKVTTKGLCPVQQEVGIECCRPADIRKSNYLPEVPNTRCRARGGDCVPTVEFTCPQFLTLRDATDCAKDETCCIFVH